VSDLFNSVVEVEEALLEVQTLLKSHFDVAGDDAPAILWTFDRAFQRFDAVFRSHQAFCHHLAI
jgi:hypothetical protein